MSLLSLTGVSKNFGARCIFQDVSMSVASGEKVALVGRNGTGKTTLLRVIAGLSEADAGSVHMARGARLGILTQDTEYTSSLTVYQEMREVLRSILDIKEQLDGLEASMSSPEVHSDPETLAEVMSEYAVMQEAYERAGGYSLDVRIKSVLFGLGFGPDDLERSVLSFSGGERVRLRLGKLLLSEPSLLLLDEPTNHLDLKATEWLEEYIKSFPGAVVVVSHDRYFLDVVSQKVVEMEHGRATVYPGNYTAYVRLKDEQRFLAEALRERQDSEAAKLSTFVDKWKAGTKSTLAKSREKALARMEFIEVPKGPGRSANIRFSEVERAGRDVITVDGLWMAFGERRLFEPFSAVITRGEKVGVIGRNGAGKSTLLRALVGAVEPSGGSIRLGHNVSVGFFSQNLDILNLDNSILEEVESSCDYTRERVRTILGSLLFSGEEVMKPIRILSGGERNRVCLAKLLVSKHNLLILDEPTNHLDIAAKDALEAALKQYDGTILLVSHDRYFLDNIVNRIIDIEDGRIALFSGNYTQYREYQASIGPEDRPDDKRIVSTEKRASAAVGRPPRDNTERTRKKLMAKLEELENAISFREQELADIEAELSDPTLYSDVEASRQVASRHQEATECLTALYSEWEEVTRASEQL